MNTNTGIAVNYEVLVWARNALALDRTNAAKKTGLSAKRLIQIEEGEKHPTLDELKELSKAYKRTIATLLLAEPPKEKPLPADRRTVDSTGVNIFHEKSILAVRKARALVTSLVELKHDAGIAIPKFPYKALIQENPASIAKKIRNELKLDEVRQFSSINIALEAYIEKIEEIGIAVFQLSLTQDKLRGFSIVDEIMPIIAIKGGGENTTAKIFTLFHELGHILLNDGGLCDLSDNSNLQIEKWCNAFAAEILIPATELLEMNNVVLHKSKGEKIWTKKELVELGDHFHVGPLAILRSLLENKLTTPEYYKSRHQAWNKPSFGKSKTPEGRNIPKETIKERGRTYVSLAFSAFDQNRIDLKDLSDFLGIRLSYIPKTRQLLNA
ncbi:MAG: ImmA/IrrE family metallo-endopeptidase [Bacteroidota bacterium]|nr:MAG: ImmA/IrrE family metallo-endopeptidase [Bacteroidota bacterium]